MNRSVFDNPEKMSPVIAVLIAGITVMVLILNGYGIMEGITNVLPHLFYIPVILTAYYFPRRGILFSILISAIYCSMTYVFNPVLSDVLLSAGGRSVIIILIATVVSLLTIRMGESEARFRGVAERSPDVILLTRLDGQVLYASPSSKRVLGYDPSELLGKMPNGFIHPEDFGLLQKSVETIDAGTIPEEFIVRFRKKDGDYAFMEFFGSPIVKDGVISGMQVIGRDVTERKHAEHEQKARDDFLNAIMESMIAGVVVIDPETHTIVDANAVAATMIGAKKEDIIGSACTNYICPALDGACPITDLHQVVDRSEKILLGADGRKCPVLKSVVPITLHNHKYLLESFIDISELYRANEAILESEEKYRLLADYTYDWEYWIAPDESIVYTTPSCERITGYSQSEFYANRNLIKSIIYPEDSSALTHHISHFFLPQKPESIDFRIVHRNGAVRWIGHVCQPIYNAKGELIGRRVSNRDITERKEAEEASHETSQRLAEIISFLPDPTMVIDKAGKVVAWNHAMEEMSGVRASDILGKGDESYTAWIAGHTGPILIDYVLHGNVDEMKSAYPNVRIEGNTVKTETDVTRVDGTVFSLWISATPLIDQKGEVTGAIESLRDVTSLKKIQRALRESNEYLDTVINTLADPLFIKDRRHRFVTLNDSFCQFTGHSRNDLLGKTDYDFFKKAEADIFWEKDEVVFETRRENENEERITDASGHTHTIVTKKTLYINSSEEEFIVGIIRDITERKKTELALQQALKKLNMLSSITRHDILNQLMGLRLFIELAKERERDPELAEFLKKGDVAADSIRRQIEFTRYYQDLGVQSPRWYDIAEIFLSAASQLPLGEIRLDVQVSNLLVYADPLIEKVFYNLMENSLRHGGHTTLLVLSAKETPEGITITYSDNGVGISEEDKQKLFRKGFGKHTGLGLFLSREILSITGISITENGKPGNGVRFEIRVPKEAFRITDAS